MRRSFAFTLLTSLALGLAANNAAATVTEPDGQQVPINSGAETQLFQLFSSLNEPIDWQADAHDTPNAFSPLCGFTAKFVLHQAGYQLGLAWYNETGGNPAGDLHIVIPAGSPVGTTITSTDIKNDPAYLGGLVGFAIVGQQTHYTNPAYNPVCDFFFLGCSNDPWIAALIYPSKVTPNAFYVAFEDGNMSDTSFGNDGDFNDDVYFLSGLTCNGGGVPCDTGLPGICGPGIMQCTAGGLVCTSLSQAAPVETCNGLDDTCDGTADEGEICPDGFVCDKGTCVQSCAGGEFTCDPTLVCNMDGYCVEPACADVDCPSGQVCVQGLCKAPCDGVICPYPQVCLVGACADPCAGVTCNPEQVCDKGVCTAPCTCAPCAAGLACDPSTGICGDPTCIGVPCGAGTHCVGGVCVDNCLGAVCPTGQVCTGGQCAPMADPTTTSASSSGVFAGVGGGGEGGMSGAGGGSSVGGAGGAGGAPLEGSPAQGPRCGCPAASVSRGGLDAGDVKRVLLAMATLGIAAWRRRRRARRA